MKYFQVYFFACFALLSTACRTTQGWGDSPADKQYQSFLTKCGDEARDSCNTQVLKLVTESYAKASKSKTALDKAIANELLYLADCSEGVDCQKKIMFSQLNEEQRLFKAVHVAYFNYLTTGEVQNPAPAYFFNEFLKNTDFETAYVSLFISTEQYSKAANLSADLRKKSMAAAYFMAFGYVPESYQTDESDADFND